MKPIEVFLAEDHELVRAGLKLLINAEADLRVVGEAADGVTACELIAQLRPQVAIIDLSMPKMSGIDLVTRLQSLPDRPRILALTANEDPGYIKLLFQLGATGYLFKRSAAEELILAIRTVARGERYLGPNLVDLLVNQLAVPASPASETLAARKERAAISTVVLSDRERDVLKLIAEGLTNKEIAARMNISIKTVETYKARGMQKLNLRGRADIVRHAVTLGWLNIP
ncbi:MAG: nreC 8 [Planctomycetaceae bacterium]|nr:nreC 8 [Planctomycetaceae bacterium]